MPAKVVSITDKLLAWYDAHGRDLPWRTRAVADGERPDPYRVWLSEVMLQQTTVATVRPRFAAWVARWPDVASLAAADETDVMAAWAGLGYYARARNLLKAARAAVAAGGFPRTEAGLRALPGLGAYTAAAVAAIAWREAVAVVDTNVERVLARLYLIEQPLPAARPAIRRAAAALVPPDRPGDLAQATMDLGATICTPRKPRCLLCPLREECGAYAAGDPERLPVKPAKKARPVRYGTVFVLRRGNDVLLVRRPDNGLLGGMRALPTGPWIDEASGLTPPELTGAPIEADWRMAAATLTHGFTHFELRLALAVADAPAHGEPDGEWWPLARLGEAGLPTLFANAARLVIEGFA